MMATFTSSINALQHSTAASAVAAQQQVQHTTEKHNQKGPSNNKLPRYSNKQTESLDNWYNDILCILALSEWKGVYDRTTNDIVPATTASNKFLSEHLYMSLHLALHGDAGLTMKNNENKFRNMGIEFLYSMKPIFNPKWPVALQATKLAEFCGMY